MSSSAADIFIFFKNFGHFLPDGQKKRLLDIHSKIEYRDKLSKVKNHFGEHYEDCVWSNSNYRAKSPGRGSLQHFRYNLYTNL